MKRKLLFAMLCIVSALGLRAKGTLDITDLYITNPSFESGNTDGWTVGSSEDTGARSTANNTYAMSNSDGNYLFNTWWQGIPITQTIESLPAGSYTLSAVVASDGATIYLISGEEPSEYVYTETTDSKTGITLTKDFTLATATNYKIGAVGGANGTAGEHKDYAADGYWWYKVDNFKLFLNLEDDATIPKAIVTKLLTSVPTGVMSTSVKSALDTAVSNFQNSATLDNYNALLTAISAANTSIANYAVISAGSISTSELGGWAISTTNGALACNTWSNEGDSDGSSMTTPFIQDWVGSGTPLAGGNAGGKLYYTLEGLNPGEQYNVSALVRVFNESEGSLDGASFYANDVSIDIDENGTACSNAYSSKGIYGTFNAKAVKVDANGKLEFGIALESTSELNWIAIKNVTISAYAGKNVESITLSQPSATLTTGDVLTLTATVSPNDADDQTVTWTSSDESVATVSGTGIVSAVGAGTATITCTANDGSGVTATCAVTVSNAAAPAYYSSISEGEFYIRNVATGRYLGQGNNWDTQASTIAHGKPITVTLSNGKYKLTNIVKSGAGLGADCFADNGTPVELTITETSEGSGIYTIAYGETLTAVNTGATTVSYQTIAATSSLAQWQFLSFDDMQKNLSSTRDATFYIKGALAQRIADSNNAWTSTNVTTGYSEKLESSNAYVCSESYQKASFSYTQTVSVPNGTYNVSVQGFARNGDVAYLVANDEKVQLRAMDSESHGMACNSRTTAAKVFEAGYYKNTVEVTVTDRTLTLGVSGSSSKGWVAWNNFELYMTTYTPNTGVAAEDVELQIGQTAEIGATTVPATASFNALTYASADETIATVNENGVVTGVAQGNTTITITANEMENFSKTINVTVKLITPTAFALSETEVALDKDNTSTTLTVNPTPAGANNAATWTSSDETVATVANGVVTAVSTGTATITATSIVDTEITATCEVTVSFPESTVPATIEYANGPALTVLTLSQNNLIKNGTFGYPNAVATWKAVNYTTDAVASNFGITAEGGAVDGGAFITTNGGKAGDATTIRKSVPVEVGKKYYFSVYTSGKAPASDNFQYNALFKMTDATTENGVLKQFEWPQGAEKTTSEWSKTEFVFTAETPYVGVRMGWNSSTNFDEFVLVEVTKEETVGNVQYALDAIPTANIGTGAFQYSQAAIDAAKALVKGTATVEDVEAAYAAVTTLKAPEATQAYNLVFNCDGHSATGNALTLIPNPEQTQGLYGLKYLAPANVNLAQAFYFTHTTGNKYKVHAIDQEGEARYITTQAEGYGTTWYDGIRTITDVEKAMEVEIRPNGEGLYLLWNTGANKAIAHNGNNNNDLFTNNTANFQFVETTKPSIEINTSVAGWGTVMLPFAVAELPSDVKAYTCAEVNGATLNLVEVTALEANNPYIIEGTWSAILTSDAQGTQLQYTKGLLTGTYERMAAPNGSYILQNQNGKVGFYQVDTEEAQPNVPANRAYMVASDGSVKAFYFDQADGITRVVEAGDEDVIYNLNGMRVQKAVKGLYIINGKKVMVK